MSLERPRNVMVDIETKGTSADAFVLSVGAVAFDDDGFLNEYEKTRPSVFYGQVPWDDPTQFQRLADPETLSWWDQKAEARDILRSPTPAQQGWVYPTLDALLASLAQFVTEQKNEAGRMVSKGVDFDIAILNHAFRSVGRQSPWRYNHTRCMRGWLDACYAFGISKSLSHGINGGNPGLKHHAADDAIWQTMIYVRYNHHIWKERNKTSQNDLFANAPAGLEAAP